MLILNYRLKSIVFTTVLIIICSIANPNIAWACSGGAPLAIKALVENSDYVVKAAPVELDDLQQNAVLRVEEYLAGGPGPEYLLYSQNNPIVIQYALEGLSSGGDCIGFAPDLVPRHPLYLFLHRRDDGSYVSVGTLFNASIYKFDSPESTVEIFPEGGNTKDVNPEYSEDFADKGSGIQVTQSEFVETIAEQSSKPSTKPIADAPYPLYAPLKIVTKNGTRYELPVDGGTPFKLSRDFSVQRENLNPLWDFGYYDAGKCAEANCVQFSPDNLNIAVQTDENTITLRWGVRVAGEASLFSPVDTIAIWNKNTLQVYTLGYPRFGEGYSRVQLVNEMKLELPARDYAGRAAWSPDGRLLAYSDAHGLWLWDVFDLNKNPRLLLPTTDQDIAFARYFSPMGRYLAISIGERRQTLDLLTGESFSDGVVSPDDRLLLAIDNGELQVCSFAPHNCTAIREIYVETFNDAGERTNLYLADHGVRQVIWEDNYRFILLGCAPENSAACVVTRLRVRNSDDWWNEQIAYGSTFAFDPANNAIAVLTHSQTVEINGTAYDLSASLDSDITEIEWLPSLFYRLDTP